MLSPSSLLDFFSGVTTKCKQLTNDPTRCWLFLSDTKQTWGGASQYCISSGGNLAVEYDLDLHNAIAKEVASYGREHNWWIGVRGNDYEHWTWNTGSHISKRVAVLPKVQLANTQGYHGYFARYTKRIRIH